MIFGWTGFAAGHFLGLWRGWLFLPVGELNFGLSTLGSLLFLVVGDWVSHIRLGDMGALPKD
jgi:hypothetical protein